MLSSVKSTRFPKRHLAGRRRRHSTSDAEIVSFHQIFRCWRSRNGGLRHCCRGNSILTVCACQCYERELGGGWSFGRLGHVTSRQRRDLPAAVARENDDPHPGAQTRCRSSGELIFEFGVYIIIQIENPRSVCITVVLISEPLQTGMSSRAFVREKILKGPTVKPIA